MKWIECIRTVMISCIIQAFQRILFIVFILAIGADNSYAQLNDAKTNQTDRNWIFGVDYGFQMSGIKNEDFISSNYSPVYRVSLGKWINQSIAIQIGYQGRYFNAIADDIKHYYNFYYSEAVFDVKNIIFNNKEKRVHEFFFHVGPGSFYNFDYGKSFIHGIIGGSNVFSIKSDFKLNLDISAIIGWDIYQGDEDILPSISLGGIYLF